MSSQVPRPSSLSTATNRQHSHDDRFTNLLENVTSIPVGAPSIGHPAEAMDMSEPISARSNIAEDESQYPSGRFVGLAFLATTLALVVTGLDNNILATAMPAITDEFGTIADVGWYYAAYRLTTCAFQFMFGRMYQVWSLKRVFLSAMVVFELGSLFAALSSSSRMLVVARAIQGLGCAGIISGCFAMVTTLLPLRRRSMFIGACSVAEEFAGAMSPLLGGMLTTRLNWRWCFWIQLPLGAFAFIITSIFYKNSRPSRYHELPLLDKLKKLDLTGTAIFVPGITALLLALQFGGTTFGWSDPRIIVCFAISAVLIGVFAWWQVHKQDKATLPPRIVRRRSILAGMWFMACNHGALAVSQYYLPIYFQSVRQTSAQTSGLLTLPFLLAFMASLAGAGFLIPVIGYYVPLMLLTTILTAIGNGLLTTLTLSAPLARIVAYQAFLGLGGGLGWQGPQLAAQRLLDPADISLGIACMQFSSSFGPAITIPIAQVMFVGLLERDLGTSAPGVNATRLEDMGLSDLSAKVQASQLQGTLEGFDSALMQTLYLPTAMACATLLGTLAMEWKSVKDKRS